MARHACDALLIVGLVLLAAVPAAETQSSCAHPRCDAHVQPEGGFSEGTRAVAEGSNTTQSTSKVIAKATGVVEAAMVTGGMCMLMALFYLVNAANHNIVSQTWQLLSSVVSIFCAVLFYTMFKAFLALMGTKVTGGVVGAFVIFVIAFLLEMELFCLARAGKALGLLAVGTVTGHICGFASIDMYGDMQETTCSLFGDSAALAFAWAAIVTIGMVFVCFVYGALRSQISSRMHPPDTWEDQCQDTENDIVALTVGLFISRAVRYAIDGALPPIEGMPMGKTSSDALLLFVSAVGFFVLLLILTAIGENLPDRISDGLSGTCAMTIAWCLLFTGQWGYWSATDQEGVFHDESMMTAKVSMALFASVVVFSLIVIVALASPHWAALERAGPPLTKALGLYMGFTWEKTFDMCVDILGDGLAGELSSDSSSLLIKAAMCFCLFWLVWPAWWRHILKRATDAVAEEGSEEVNDEDDDTDSELNVKPYSH